MGVIEDFRSLTRYWWLVLIFGMAVLAVGVLVFMDPVRSYWGLTVVFGIMMLVSGLLELVVAFTEKYLPGRGWVLTGGIVELLLGILLLYNPAFTAVMLPYFLAFWLLFRGFSLISLAIDMRSLKVAGMGWTIVTAVLLIASSLMILFSPVQVGAGVVIIWVGIALLAAGLSIIVFALELFSIRNKGQITF